MLNGQPRLNTHEWHSYRPAKIAHKISLDHVRDKFRVLKTFLYENG